MKIFLDSANRDLIKKWLPTGLVDGITTNPSLLSKEGPSTREVLKEICELVPGPVSIEVVEKSPDAVYAQAKTISKFAPNVVVKIPCAQEYFPVIDKLSQEGVKLNITLVFSEVQALLVAKLGVTYISPFIGRWDDIGTDGIALVERLVKIMKLYAFSSEILAASVRSVLHMQRIALTGAHVMTVPPTLLEQAISHPLTHRGIEIFDNDWKKLGKTSLLE